MGNKKVIPALLIVSVLTMTLSAFPVGASNEDVLDDVPKNIPKGLSLRVFIKYAGPVKQVTANVTDLGDPNGDGAQDGYELSGLWWNLSKYEGGVPYVINPSGAVKQGLDQYAVIDEITASLESWDAQVGVELYNDTVTVNTSAKASTYWPDYKNVITWARLRPRIVATATIWYYTATGEIADADIQLNSRYKWGIDPDDEGPETLTNNKFDIQNIVTHEAGHWSGLGDLYENYYEMTMYGYTTYGETKKISLEYGDIVGVQQVYGAP